MRNGRRVRPLRWVLQPAVPLLAIGVRLEAAARADATVVVGQGIAGASLGQTLPELKHELGAPWGILAARKPLKGSP